MIKHFTKLLIILAMITLTSAVYAEAPPVVNVQAQPSSDMEQFKEQIKRLEDKLTKMEEENDIRRRLETTQEEKSSEDDAILSAAGRDYTLMKPGKLGFEYSIRYAGDSYDNVTANADSIVAVKHNAYHTVTNSFLIEYPVKENLTVNSNIPFVYKYNSQTNTSAKNVSDFGDTSFGLQFQPVKSGKDLPSIIVSGSLTCPTGRSPYKIDSTKEMSTGNGTYSIGMGCNVSKSIDPLVAFGGINVEHGIETTHLNSKTGTQGEAGIFLAGVKPGEVYSFSMGIGYSLSYKASLTLSYQYSYQSKTSYDWVRPEGPRETRSEGSISSVFSIGTGWNITPKRSVNVRLGIGLTNNDSDFSLQVRVPFAYEL
ncbi:MAG: transporter [Proteobacteria bacterium]|nr:transporter [Pseudomonadota bacterium]